MRPGLSAGQPFPFNPSVPSRHVTGDLYLYVCIALCRQRRWGESITLPRSSVDVQTHGSETESDWAVTGRRAASLSTFCLWKASSKFRWSDKATLHARWLTVRKSSEPQCTDTRRCHSRRKTLADGWFCITTGMVYLQYFRTWLADVRWACTRTFSNCCHKIYLKKGCTIMMEKTTGQKCLACILTYTATSFKGQWQCVFFLTQTFHRFLGAFAKLRKPTVSFTSVRPAWNNSTLTGRIFMKFGVKLFPLEIYKEDSSLIKI
jgi:hypothetical protein